MTEADAFMAAILDDPWNDAPRLMFADWLEERGESDRAEFIRVQCALASPDAALVPNRDGPLLTLLKETELVRESLRRRERELWFGSDSINLGGMSFDFWADFGSNPGLDQFRRGFVERVTCSASDLLVHGTAVLAAQPVLEVEFANTSVRLQRVECETIAAFLVRTLTEAKRLLIADEFTVVEGEMELMTPEQYERFIAIFEQSRSDEP